MRDRRFRGGPAWVLAVGLAACGGGGGGGGGGGEPPDATRRVGDPLDAGPADAGRPDVPFIRDCEDGETRPCGTDAGVCAPGVQRCVQGLWAPDCEGAVEPGEERCNGLDDDCDGQTDEGFGVGRRCKRRDERNLEVDGVLACDAASGGAVCKALPDCDHDADADGFDVCRDCDDADPHNFPGNAERCDGRDNDCDARLDETFVLGEICYAGEGVCRRGGQTVCDPVTFGVTCSATPAPVEGPELCGNQLDDDCDGRSDEGFDLGVACAAGVGACAREGVTVCGPDRRTVACDARPGAPSPERCGNGVDDDCDGQTDEGFDLGTPCTAGVGACAREGVVACGPDGAPACTAVPGAPVAERCGNDADDDCDGRTDEGFDTGAPCTAGVGACARDGLRICNPAGDGTVCDARPGAPGLERCGNGVDDDCDGQTDEGFDAGAACAAGVGECRREGRLVCAVDGDGTVCDAQPAPPAAERCDGLDNDCDGEVDEDFDLGAPCRAGTGACAVEGRRVCAPDGSGACDAVPRNPQPERCNDADDDCDGEVDEDFPGLGEACDDPGDPDQCARGVRRCDVESGEAVCAGDVPSPEICNFRDDDCDGEVDDGFDLFTDPLNCGACGEVCPPPHGACRDATCYRDYWVSADDGSDALGDGSRESPWRTIRHAADTVEGPLATINVLPGLYDATRHPEEPERFPIALREGVPIRGAGAPETIVVDGGHAGTVFVLQNLERDDNGLMGLTIRRGGRPEANEPAILVTDAVARLEDLHIEDARGRTRAAAIDADGGAVTVDRCVVTGSRGTHGAGIVTFSNGRRFALLRSHLRGNAVDRAGVVQARAARLRVENTTLAGNEGSGVSAEFHPSYLEIVHTSVADHTGSGLQLRDGTTGVIYNSILAFNDGWGIQETGPQADPEAMRGTLIHGNGAGAYLTEGQRTISDPDDLGGGAYDGDPLFFSLQAGNLRLRPGSAAIDRAVPDHAVPFDQDGNPRPRGGGPDSGAFEAEPE